jgi:hypothetical protein
MLQSQTKAEISLVQPFPSFTFPHLAENRLPTPRAAFAHQTSHKLDDRRMNREVFRDKICIQLSAIIKRFPAIECRGM